MRAKRTSGTRPPGPTDRDVWRRSHEIEAPADEAERLLDLAAFADSQLDEDDIARVAALLARDAGATSDVAAARLLADATMEAAAPEIIGRAAALVGEELPEARVIAFPARPPMPRPWFSAARWSGLAAAMVLAGWLGFNLGSGLPGIAPAGHVADEASATELFDPAPPLILRDFSENSQI
jgi:anti-sigma factor RsiW